MDYKFVKELPPHLQQQQQQQDNKPLDPSAIPDLEELLKNIIEMVKYTSTEEMIEMEKTNPIMYEQHLDEKFECISSRYYGMFKLLLVREEREENLCKLIDMFTKLRDIKQGKIDIQNADKQYQESLNEEYVYPQFGGKDGYEKKLAEMGKHQKSKKNKSK